MQNNYQQLENDEINLKYWVTFFKLNYLLIILYGVIGIAFSATYVALAPKKFEAQLQIQMAQMFNSSNSEEPYALISRMRTPTAYPIGVQKICGIPEGVEFGDFLDGALKFDVVKNVPNIIDMRVIASSPEISKSCATAVASMIENQQRGLIEDRLVGRLTQLKQYKNALKEEMGQFEKINRSELSNFRYLANLDKLSFLRTRIDALQEEVDMAFTRPAKIITQIHVLRKPVSPKVGIVLVLGGLLGVMLGVFYAIGRKARFLAD